MKHTRKFVLAKQKAYELGIRWSYAIENEQLYKLIEAKGWAWDGKRWAEKAASLKKGA